MGINPTKIIKNMVVEATKDTKELFEQINEKIDLINDKLDKLENQIKYTNRLVHNISVKKDNEEENEILTENGF